MTRRALALLLASTAALPSACATNDDAAPPLADAGTDSPADSAAATDGSETVDAGVDPPKCVGEWCTVSLEGLSEITLNGIWGSAPNDVWVVGTRGFAAHFDGATWEVRRANTLLSLFSVWGSGPNDVWVGNNGKNIFHWQGSSWEESSISTDDPRAVIAMGGSGPENVFALVAADNIHSRECPGDWGPVGVYCPTVFRFSRIEGQLVWRDATNANFICDNLYTKAPNGNYCPNLSGLWVGPDGEPWFVGQSGKAIRPRGTATPPEFAAVADETHSITTFDAVGGSSTNDVWAVGAAGAIRHFSGGNDDWAIVASPTNTHLRAVWAGATAEAWAVGDDGTVLQWDGTSWKLAATPLSARPRHLYAVWGTPRGDTWTVGEHVIMQRHPNSASNP